MTDDEQLEACREEEGFWRKEALDRWSLEDHRNRPGSLPEEEGKQPGTLGEGKFAKEAEEDHKIIGIVGYLGPGVMSPGWGYWIRENF